MYFDLCSATLQTIESVEEDIDQLRKQMQSIKKEFDEQVCELHVF